MLIDHYSSGQGALLDPSGNKRLFVMCMDHPNLIAALESLAGVTDNGFTFITTGAAEEFVSFDALRGEAQNRAAHFRSLGLSKGDRVALVLPDGQDFVPTFMGAIWAGLVPVPLYPPLSLGKLDSYIDGLVAIMGRAEATYLATNAKLEQVLWSAANRVPSLKGLVTAETLRTPAPATASREAAKVSGDDIAFLQFTSGSTSLPKGVEVTHASLRANAWAIVQEGLKCGPTDHGVSWLPLYHDMGLIGFVISPVFHQVRVTFIPTMSFVRNATLWLDVMHRKSGTHDVRAELRLRAGHQAREARAARPVGPVSRPRVRLRRRAHQPGDPARVRRQVRSVRLEAARRCCPATAWPKRRSPSASSASTSRCRPTSSTRRRVPGEPPR